jgi:MFS family permease
MDALRKRLINLFAINVAFSTSMKIIQSLFPLFLRGLNASEVEIGLVIAAGNITTMVTMIPGSLLINKLGRKKMLIISVFFVGIPPLFFMVIKDWRYVIPFLMILSVSWSFFTPSRMSIVAESANQSNAASLFGLMNLAWPLGGIVAPVLSGYIIERASWNQVFMVSVIISAASLIPALLLEIGETVPNRGSKDKDKSSMLVKDDFPTVSKFFFLNFLQTIGLGGIFMILPLYLMDFYGLTPSYIGLFFTVSNLISLFTQVPSGYLADRFGKRRFMMGVILPIPILFFMWGMTSNWVYLLVLFSLSFTLWSMTWPSAVALISDSFEHEKRGTAFSVMMTAERLAFAVGPILAGYMYASLNPVYPFYLTGIGFALSLIPIYLLIDKNSSSIRIEESTVS